jgi:uncharacterized protein (DUF58 family)
MAATDSNTTRATSDFTMPLVLGLVAAVLLIALLAEQSTLALLCLAVLAIMAGAKTFSRLSLARISSALRVDKVRVFPGEQLRVEALVHNAKPIPIWLHVRAPCGNALRAAHEASGQTGLSAHEQVVFEWQLTALRRGVHRIGPLELQAADPLGFFLERTRAGSCELIVFPRLVPLAARALPRRELYGRPGARTPFEDPTYLQGAREYRGGRAARHIHWKASARHGRLVEKVSESSQQENVLLLIATDGFAEPPAAAAFERCLEVAASLGVQLDRSGRAIGLATNACITGGFPAALRPGRAPGQIASLLETMARLEPTKTGSLLALVQQSAVVTWSTTVVCFVHRIDADHATLCAWLQRRKVPLVTIVCAGDAGALRPGSAGHEVHALDALLAQPAPGGAFAQETAR